MKTYDLIIAGAGVAGCAAAVAAADCGMSVMLIEQFGGPGGVAVEGGCPDIMGLSDNRRQIVGGFADALIRRLDRRGRARLIDQDSGRIRPEPIGDRPLIGTVMSTSLDLRLELAQMLEERGVELLGYSRIIGCRKNHGRLSSVKVANYAGTAYYSAGVFIDATGNGELAALAGATGLLPDSEAEMTKTLLFSLGGVADFDKAEMRAIFEQQVAAGTVPYPTQDRFMGIEMLDGRQFLCNLSLCSGNAFDARDLTRMDLELRRQIPVWVDFLRTHFPPFAGCYVTSVAPMVGVRDSRGMLGRTLIRCRDLDENTPVAAPVALAPRCYGGHGLKCFQQPGLPINRGCRPVPMGALQSAEFDNLLAAGKTISIEPMALTSVRLMAVCMATGQASGIIAAHGAGNADYHEIQPVLQRQNAFFKQGER